MKTTKYIAALAVLAMAFVGFSAIVADNADADAVVLDGNLMGYANNGDSTNPMVVKYYKQTTGDTTQNYIVLEFDGKAPTSAFKLYASATDGSDLKTIPVVATDSIVFGWVTLTEGKTYKILVDPIDGSADRTVDIKVQKTVEVTYHANLEGVATVTEFLPVSAEQTLVNKFATVDYATYKGYIAKGNYTPDENDIITITADPVYVENTSSFTNVNAVDLYTMWTQTIEYNGNTAAGTMTASEVLMNADIATQKLTANAFTLYGFAGWATTEMPTIDEDFTFILDEAVVDSAFLQEYMPAEGTLTLYAIWQITIAYEPNFETEETMDSDSAYVGAVTSGEAGQETTVATIIPGTLAKANEFSYPGYTFTKWTILDAEATPSQATILPDKDLNTESAAIIQAIVEAGDQTKTYTTTLQATWEERSITVDVFITEITEDNEVKAKVNDLAGEDLIVGYKLTLGGTYYTNATFNGANVLVYGDIEDLSLTPAVVSGDVSPSMTLTVDMTTYTPYWVYAVYSDSNDSKIGESYGVLKNTEDENIVTLTAVDKTDAPVEGVTIPCTGAQLKGTTVTLTAAGVPEGKVVTFYSEEECTTPITTIIMDGDKTVYYKVTNA